MRSRFPRASIYFSVDSDSHTVYLPDPAALTRLALRKSLRKPMAKLGKRQLPNAPGRQGKIPATAVWISFTQDPSRSARAWTVKGRDPTSLPFDSRETETHRGVTCQRSRREGSRNPRLQTPRPGSPPLSPPSPFRHSGTAPRLGSWVNPGRTALGANRGH